VSAAKRSTAFGVFDTGFGIAWFLGSALLGFLYDRSLVSMIIISVLFQLLALPLFIWGNTSRKHLRD
jgi:predicted MFS family arabinose efflux permease